MAGTTASSMIDVVDEATGRPVATATRSEALEQGLAVRTVHVFLGDGAGRLLLQQLGSGRDRHPLLWGSSAAAFPHPGEAEDEAASRRLAEELGLSIPLRRLGVLRAVDGSSPKFVTLFEGDIVDTPRIAEPDHVERVELWRLDAIDAALAEVPLRFTDTFRQVYGWWRRERSGR